YTRLVASFLTDPPTTAIYTLSLHDALPIFFTGTYALLPAQTVFAAFGVVLTAGYLLWMLRRAFFGPLNMKWSWLTDATLREAFRSEEHTSELQSRFDLVCRLLLEKKNQLMK